MCAKRIVRKSRRRQHARVGRPPVHDESWSKVSVVLFDRQILRLDRLVNEIRQKTGKVLNRAALIRAVVDGTLDSKFEMTTVESEHDLRTRIATHLRS